MNYNFKLRGDFIIGNLSKRLNFIDSKLNTVYLYTIVHIPL